VSSSIYTHTNAKRCLLIACVWRFIGSQAVPSARILLRHTRQQCLPDIPHPSTARLREIGESNIHVPYGKGAVGIAAERKGTVTTTAAAFRVA
jgi:hypothetical protein